MQRSPGLGKKSKSLKGRKARRIYYEHANQRLEELTKNEVIFQESETLSIEDVARLLGFSRATIRKWIKEGFLAAHKTATGRIYFLRSDFNKKMAPQSKVLNVKEVAAKLAVNPETVSIWIRRGQLSAYKLGNRWQVTEEDLQNFIDCRWII